MSLDAERSEEPTDRLTRLCDAMAKTLEEHAEYREGDRCMILINDEERGGLVMHGYEDDETAISELLTHLKAIFEVNGMTLMIAPLNEG
jgi:hypothetical protein